MLNANGCKRIACITIDKKKENRQQNHKDTIRYSAKILVHTLQNKTYFHQKEYAPRYMKVMCMLILFPFEVKTNVHTLQEAICH